MLPLKYFVELANDVYLNREHVWSKPGAIAVVLAWGAAGSSWRPALRLGAPRGASDRPGRPSV